MTKSLFSLRVIYFVHRINPAPLRKGSALIFQRAASPSFSRLSAIVSSVYAAEFIRGPNMASFARPLINNSQAAVRVQGNAHAASRSQRSEVQVSRVQLDRKRTMTAIDRGRVARRRHRKRGFKASFENYSSPTVHASPSHPHAELSIEPRIRRLKSPSAQVSVDNYGNSSGSGCHNCCEIGHSPAPSRLMTRPKSVFSTRLRRKYLVNQRG